MAPVKRELSEDDDDDFLDQLMSEEEEDEDIERNEDVTSILQGALKRPIHTTYNLKHIHDLIHTGGVELDPAYQREVVWSELKMIGLIQSLFMNYYIPPIVFSVNANVQEQSETRVCIDGKQRCSSIARFMNGEIPFLAPKSKQKYWYTNYGNPRHKLLPEALRRRFDQIVLQVVEYDNLPEDMQRDIFQRVQLGMALSAAEKLQAIPGPWSAWILELQKKYITEPNTLNRPKVEMDTSRGRAFQNLVAIVMLCYGQDKAPTAIKMHQFLERKDPPPPVFRKKVEMALSLMVDIAYNHYNESIGTVKQPRIAPVEFHFIIYLIFSRMGYLSTASLAKTVGQLRQTIRNKYIDIRANGRVMNDLHAFINSVPRRTVAGERAAAEEYQGDEIDPREQRALKRSRQAEQQDPDYHGDVVPRDAQPSEAATNTRSKSQKLSINSRPTRPPVPSVAPPPRPGNSGMDALPTPQSGLSPNFGQLGSTRQQNSNNNNPYVISGEELRLQQTQGQTYGRVSPYAPQQQYNQNGQNAYNQPPQQQQYNPYGQQQIQPNPYTPQPRQPVNPQYNGQQYYGR
ncbi:hypothetical protein M231_07438 [Tremella mesenterica]|uniref:GmrSD restriction endonucleases N-terminal domain-containing protein n=1 Tax=Tremella mesenterica TaxID=5217 RepID=A0A4Q1B947_TREME|nr:uncharacterized protein TREMEDRAFT_59344 [Tremella mesenterica DSM 1558]EIW73182.1 hypothetical protein TREMEDRAFT_59344 [Tremella mesenterica DSM 1558]RXK35299.1 hypothetical protein M231_07438 [Tremella mesenterica]